LKKIEDQLQDQEIRIRALEISLATVIERMDNLCKSLDGLVSWIKAVVGLLTTSLIGFFFWYIQKLGG